MQSPIIVVILVAAGAAIVLTNGSNNEPATDGFDIKPSVVRNGDTQKVAFEASENIFNKGVAASDIIVYVTGLDGYVHSDWFDSTAFMVDLSESAYADDYDLIISSDAVKLTESDITVTQDGGNKLAI